MKAQLTYTRTQIQQTVCLNGFDVGVVMRVSEQTRYTRRNAITAWCTECSADVGPGGVECLPSAPHHFGTEQEACDAVGEHALKCSPTIIRIASASDTVAA